MKKTFIILLVLTLSIILTFCSSSPTSDDPELSAPSDLELSLVGNNQVKLTWQSNSTEATVFMIDRKEGVFDWYENYGEVEENITSFIDNIPTESDTIYSYRIRAFDGDDYSYYSTTVGWFSWLSSPSESEIIDIGQDSIQINWNDNSFGEMGFKIDRKINEDSWQIAYKTLAGNSTEFKDNVGSAFNTYRYKIYAFVGNSMSDFIQELYTVTFNPKIIGFLEINNMKPFCIDVLNNYAYITNRNGGMLIVDISNPSNLNTLGYCEIDSDCLGIKVNNNYAYIAKDGGLSIVDITNPNNPFEIGDCNTNFRSFGIDCFDDYVIVSANDDEYSGLRIINVENPTNPVIVGLLDLPSHSSDIFIKDTYAYIANDGYGLQIVDISNPTNPNIIGTCDTDNRAFGVIVLEDFAYVADQNGGLKAIDISNQNDPQIVGTYPNGFFLRININNNNLYLTSHTSYYIININDPFNPHIIGSYFNMFEDASGIAIKDDQLFITDAINDFSGSLTVFDIVQ